MSLLVSICIISEFPGFCNAILMEHIKNLQKSVFQKSQMSCNTKRIHCYNKKKCPKKKENISNYSKALIQWCIYTGWRTVMFVLFLVISFALSWISSLYSVVEEEIRFALPWLASAGLE